MNRQGGDIMKISGKLLLILLLAPSVFVSSVTCEAQAPAEAAEAAAADAQAAQERWVAVVTSAQGGVYVQRPGQTQWGPLKVADKCYPGDSIRVEENSRAALVFKNDSTLRIDQNTTLTFQPMEEQTILMRILNGAATFFSRIPRSLKIFTPHMNGTVKGTEFVIRVDGEQTQINLFDGQILAENEKGELLISKGQSVIAKTGQAPMPVTVVRPWDAVQWALYYPAIMDFRPEDFPGGADWQGKVRQSIEAWRKGDLSGAFGSLKGIDDAGVKDTRYLAYRATLSLAVGQAQEASVYLDRILKEDPKNANAYALQSIIATTQNNKPVAMDLAKKATTLDPQLSTAWIALSYVQQAIFDIPGATASVQEAVRVSPNDAYAHARLAELWLMQGWLNRALEEAQRAVSIKPELARTHTVLGFAFLMQVNIADSRAAFEKAIRLDSADPLPRLGLGLAIIRKGGLEAGRREIEIAASLDVNNALIRSYLGKAYYEEKRENLSATQLGIAKELDPQDPTPWFYDAILKQSVNRPVEALQDIQKSIELNGNRAVFRSKLLLDQDLAARSASQGRIYNNLGFQQLALVEGWKGVNYDPTDFSSHRLLAESYGSLNKHQIAQASELLQAQMLQPININPVPLQLADTNLNIQQGAGPSSPAYNEYNPLFNRNQVSLQAGGVWGQQNTYGDEVTLNGVYDRYSMSLGQLYYKTDGFRVNNDLTKEIYNLFAQASLTYQTSVQAELRYTDDRNGDLPLRFNPALTDETLRSSAYASSVRLGLRHSFTPNSDLLVSLSYRNAHYGDTSSDEIFNYDFPNMENGYMGEIQYLYRSDRFRAIVGGGYASVMGSGDINITMPNPPDPPIPIMNQPYDNDTHHTNGYAYTYTNWPQPVTWTLGLSYDKQTIGFYNNLEQDQVNPKIGMTWNPLTGTTVRAAAFRTLQRTLLTGQTLEPTQVAGFNQFYQDGNGTDSWRYGVGLDQKITDSLFAGFEGSYRDIKTPYLSISSGSQKVSWEEETARVYLYWAPHKWFALTAEYRYERSDSKPEAPAPADLYSTKINTHRVPLGVQFFHPVGFFAGVRGTYVAQDVTTAESIAVYPYTFYDDSSNFWVFDAAIGYRLPKRYGIVSVEAKNLFNAGFNFTDTNKENPFTQPQRLIVGKITLYF